MEEITTIGNKLHKVAHYFAVKKGKEAGRNKSGTGTRIRKAYKVESLYPHGPPATAYAIFIYYR